MELYLGPGSDPSKFASDDERRAAWFEHRDELLVGIDHPEKLWGWHYEGEPDAG